MDLQSRKEHPLAHGYFKVEFKHNCVHLFRSHHLYKLLHKHVQERDRSKVLRTMSAMMIQSMIKIGATC